MDADEFGENTRVYITDYIKFADAKAGGLLTLVAAILGVLGGVAGKVIATIHSGPAPLAVVAFVSAGAIMLSGFLSIWRALEALNPRTGAARASLASFPDIASDGPDNYLKKVGAIAAGGWAGEYALGNAALARVASEKFKAIKKTIWWTRVLLFSTLIVVIVHVVAKVAARERG